MIGGRETGCEAHAAHASCECALSSPTGPDRYTALKLDLEPQGDPRSINAGTPIMAPGCRCMASALRPEEWTCRRVPAPSRRLASYAVHAEYTAATATTILRGAPPIIPLGHHKTAARPADRAAGCSAGLPAGAAGVSRAIPCGGQLRRACQHIERVLYCWTRASRAARPYSYPRAHRAAAHRACCRCTLPMHSPAAGLLRPSRPPVGRPAGWRRLLRGAGAGAGVGRRQAPNPLQGARAAGSAAPALAPAPCSRRQAGRRAAGVRQRRAPRTCSAGAGGAHVAGTPRRCSAICCIACQCCSRWRCCSSSSCFCLS